MKHVVLRIIEGLPAFIKDEHKTFVELLRAYYEWQTRPGKVLDALYSHDGLMDIDVAGLDRSIQELGEEFVPVEHRRAWKMFAQQFNSSRGSIQSYRDLFRIVFDSPVEIDNTVKYVFKTSAATRERYHRIIVACDFPIPTTGVVYQESTGIRADIVESVRYLGGSGVHELLVKPRRGEFLVGGVVVQKGTWQAPATIIGHAAFAVTSGETYRLGDEALFEGAFLTVKGVVSKLHPADITGVEVVAAGLGYRVGDVVTIKGARGWRGEVAGVTNLGAIESVRIIDPGDLFFGNVDLTLHSSTGTGAVLVATGTFGRPMEFEWQQQPFGEGTVTVLSSTGKGFAYDLSHFLWYPVYIQTGFNGVVGIGTIITDSNIWQDASYRVKTPADFSDWGVIVKKMLHPLGKNMGVVKTVKGSVSVSGNFTADTTVAAV